MYIIKLELDNGVPIPRKAGYAYDRLRIKLGIGHSPPLLGGVGGGWHWAKRLTKAGSGRSPNRRSAFS